MQIIKLQGFFLKADFKSLPKFITIAIATLSDWLKFFAPDFQLMKSKTKTNCN